MSLQDKCFLIRKRFPGQEAEGIHGPTQAYDGNDAWWHANEGRPRWHDGTRRYADLEAPENLRFCFSVLKNSNHRVGLALFLQE